VSYLRKSLARWEIFGRSRIGGLRPRHFGAIESSGDK
jgi:hypothetical protein